MPRSTRNLPVSLAIAAMLAICPLPGLAAESQVLLKTTRSWDGKPYPPYGASQPEITVLRILIPAHSTLAWHHHPVINAAYVLQGALTVEKRGSDGKPGDACSIAAGEVLPELVNQVHRGYTGAEPATLIVFYAGTEGSDITVPDILPAGATPAQQAVPCRQRQTPPA
jgi:quercetin dioxygenase-like cupin family protein